MRWIAVALGATLAAAGLAWGLVTTGSWPLDDREQPAAAFYALNGALGRWLVDHGEPIPAEGAADRRPRARPVLATSFSRAPCAASSGKPVVVMEAAEHRTSLDSGSGHELLRGTGGAERGWAALRDPLMRSRLVEVVAVLGEDMLQMVPAEQKDMVEALSS